MQIINVIMFFALVIIGSLTSSMPNNDETTIIIENGKAILADVDKNGEVVKRYLEVPEYFESEKSHDEKVKAAKKKYEILKKHQIDQIRFIPFDGTFEKLDQNAMTHLHHVANHYKQTYANQIKITAAKRADNTPILDHLLDDVVFVLRSLNVAEEDIEVVYKNDKGDEPLQFVKVQSSLK